MAKKLATIDLKGKAYATVPTRIKEFREMCPNGLIETKPNMLPDGRVIFATRILKDKSNPESGESTGNAIGYLNDPTSGKAIEKAFEKLETISVGRALALLGFMASGDVASFEEMEDFLSEKETARQLKIQEIIAQVDAIDDIEVLRKFFTENKGHGVEVDSYIMEKSKQLKANPKKTDEKA